MFMCRQVAKALLDKRFHDLPLRSRIGLLTHVFLCPMCGSYHRKVVNLQEAVRKYVEQEEADLLQAPGLSEEKLHEFAKALAREMHPEEYTDS